MAAEVLADQDQAQRVDSAKRATGQEENGAEERQVVGRKGQHDRDERGRDRGEPEQETAVIAVGEDAEETDEERLAKTKHDNQLGRPLIGETVHETEQGQQALGGGRGDADQ